MTDIYIIRHAEAEGNIFRRFHGQYDSLLTPRGHKQVKCLEKRFENIHIDACFSSDLTRTSLTSRSIYVPKGLKLHRDPRFREVHGGIWEDIPFAYLDRFDAKNMWEFNHAPKVWRVEGSEVYDGFTQRFIEAMTEAAERFDSGTIAIFGHGAVIRCTLLRLFFGNDLSKIPYSDNTGVCKLRYHKGNFSYEFLNDSSHIPEELSTFHIQRWWRETDNREEAAVYFRVKETTGSNVHLEAILKDKAIGSLILGAADGNVGHILDMRLDSGYDGRYYGDQLLGEAFSHFRKLSCRSLCAAAGEYPDDILKRYEFDPITGCRSIDTTVFEW